MTNNVTNKWFLTGTDTEVGKTVVSCALLQAAAALGYRCAGYKPVASGSKITAQGLRNSDAVALQYNSNITLDYNEVNPFVFAEPTSPHIVSKSLNQPISLQIISDGLEDISHKAEWILVEGAGGWFTPLSDEHTFADWVKQEQLAVILVVGVKLGCINHAMLTEAAIRQAGLTLVGWVANDIEAPGARHSEYLDALIQRIEAPCIGHIPYLSDLDQSVTKSLAEYIQLNMMSSS